MVKLLPSLSFHFSGEKQLFKIKYRVCEIVISARKKNEAGKAGRERGAGKEVALNTLVGEDILKKKEFG